MVDKLEREVVALRREVLGSADPVPVDGPPGQSWQ
eukprot:SAG22_NODE_14_length_33165_cov_13.196698_24_plen_35_part_00